MSGSGFALFLAAALIIAAVPGPGIFYVAARTLSGGRCDGSSPMCYPLGEFVTGSADVLLGTLEIEGVAEPVPVWMSAAQFEYWSHTHLTIDVVPGRGGGFSLEAPLGVRFLIRSRMLSDEEMAGLGMA